jgi:glycosyltransferase involved in cell wall biosynthesis
MSVYKNDKPDLLKKAFSSIAEQNYPADKIRIYLGIDGEISQELEVIITSCNLVYKIQRNEKNIGLSATLNKLVNMLENEEFVFRMDADDVSLPGRFEAQVKYMLENPNVDILGTSLTEVNEKGEEVCTRTYPTQK